jgi:hypothetical protein
MNIEDAKKLVTLDQLERALLEISEENFVVKNLLFGSNYEFWEVKVPEGTLLVRYEDFPIHLKGQLDGLLLKKLKSYIRDNTINNILK